MTEMFADLGLEVGNLVAKKNKAYGDSAGTAGEMLKLLWPNGVPVEQYNDMLLLVRVWDKMKRIATDKTALGEDPWADITGYGLLGLAQHRRNGESKGLEIETDEEVSTEHLLGRGARACRCAETK